MQTHLIFRVTALSFWDMGASLSCRGHADHDDCTCFVCLEVLLDPVTLPSCGHTLDRHCLERVYSTAQRACPMCRHPLPAVFPTINLQMRTIVQRRHPAEVHTRIQGRLPHPADPCQDPILRLQWAV